MRVKSWVTVPAALVAVIVTGYLPAVPALGMPVNDAVLVLNTTPLGRAPDSVILGVG